jgi:DNA-3-methyladenine glycosylase I
MMRYHDEEWGVPVHDDQRLFEFLVLEGAQAGLSWQTILRKRKGYRRAFAGFDPARVAAFGEVDRARLLADGGIVRNRLKIDAAIENARRFLEVQKEYGSFDRYIWGFTGDHTLRRSGAFTLLDLPTRTPEAEDMSRDLRKRGFKFVGPTICYAFMEAVGMVNDHISSCFLAPKD